VIVSDEQVSYLLSPPAPRSFRQSRVQYNGCWAAWPSWQCCPATRLSYTMEQAGIQVIGFILVVIAIVLWVLVEKTRGKPPSAVHDPVAYKKHYESYEGCMSILGIIFWIGIFLMCGGPEGASKTASAANAAKCDEGGLTMQLMAVYVAVPFLPWPTEAELELFTVQKRPKLIRVAVTHSTPGRPDVVRTALRMARTRMIRRRGRASVLTFPRVRWWGRSRG
jgi:hypothetical protein